MMLKESLRKSWACALVREWFVSLCEALRSNFRYWKNKQTNPTNKQNLTEAYGPCAFQWECQSLQRKLMSPRTSLAYPNSLSLPSGDWRLRLRTFVLEPSLQFVICYSQDSFPQCLPSPKQQVVLESQASFTNIQTPSVSTLTLSVLTYIACFPKYGSGTMALWLGEMGNSPPPARLWWCWICCQ